MHASSETHGVTEHRLTGISGTDLSKLIADCLSDNKAEDIISIDLHGKTSIADYMIVASGRSQRQVGALADYVIKAIKAAGIRQVTTEGQDQADWVLIDAADVIVHIFRPEVRGFYNLEKMWTQNLSDDKSAAEQAPVTDPVTDSEPALN